MGRVASSARCGAAGKLNTILTRAPFAGRTSSGIAHGMSRADVKKKLGGAVGQADDALMWIYPGLVITFDAFGAVKGLVLTKS